MTELDEVHELSSSPTLGLIVVILTMNEEIHIRRCLEAIFPISPHVLVVDSGSQDATCEIAASLGARVITNPFVTQAQQFNWALTQLPEDARWVLRIDADEVVSCELAENISTKLENVDDEVKGFEILRRISFLGKPIRWGGLFPIPVVRLFRVGYGISEDRWMDEHIIVSGRLLRLKGEMLDDNRNGLSKWIEKHNNYSSREAVEILNKKYSVFQRSESSSEPSKSVKLKRLLKEKIYLRFPMSVRSLLYFIYRYFFRLGLLDGSRGMAFHILQGFWYRYLVDLKVAEVDRHIHITNSSVEDAIYEVLGIDVRCARSFSKGP